MNEKNIWIRLIIAILSAICAALTASACGCTEAVAASAGFIASTVVDNAPDSTLFP